MSILFPTGGGYSILPGCPGIPGPFWFGGGGSAASERYNATAVNQWLEWLKGDQDLTPPVTSAINAAEGINAASSGVGGSPFADVEAYDPDSQLSEIAERADAYKDKVESWNPLTDVPAALTTVTDAADAALFPEGRITDLVDAFEAREKRTLAREMSRTAGTLLDLRAVMTSTFDGAMASLQGDFAARVSEFEARLRLGKETERNGAVVTLLQEYLRNTLAQIQAYQNLVAIASETARITITAKQDQLQTDLKYETEDALWDLELLHYAGNMMSAISGAAILPDRQTKGERLLASITNALGTTMQVASMGGGLPASAGMGAFTFLAQQTLIGRDW